MEAVLNAAAKPSPGHPEYAHSAKKTVRGVWNQKPLKKESKDPYHDMKCHADFENLEEFHAYAERVFLNQGGRCAITGVFLANPKVDNKGKGTWDQVSLDATDPRLGHTKGNLRFICAGFQSGNYDKRKMFDAADDAPTWWTPALWKAYAAYMVRHLALQRRAEETTAPTKLAPHVADGEEEEAALEQNTKRRKLCPN